jgi:hypothetical protein
MVSPQPAVPLDQAHGLDHRLGHLPVSTPVAAGAFREAAGALLGFA